MSESIEIGHEHVFQKNFNDWSCFVHVNLGAANTMWNREEMLKYVLQSMFLSWEDITHFTVQKDIVYKSRRQKSCLK